MSSLPGYTLEAFLMWNFNIKVEESEETNVSLMFAEALGNIPPRPVLSTEQFSKIVEIFESYREYVEYKLEDFVEECQSWRNYSGSIDIPEDLYDKASGILKNYE